MKMFTKPLRITKAQQKRLLAFAKRRREQWSNPSEWQMRISLGHTGVNPFRDL